MIKVLRHKMKVLFVYPDIGVRGGARSYQFGIGMLSAVLKAHGHETRLHYMFGAYDPAPLKHTIAAYQPDLIAFSAVSPQFRFVKQIFKDLQPLPAFTILGGHHATLARSAWNPSMAWMQSASARAN